MTDRTAGRRARADRLAWRVTLGGLWVLAAFLLVCSVWGLVLSWRVAAAFRTGDDIVHWPDGPDLVVMAAPLLVAALGRAVPLWSVRRPVLGLLWPVLLTVLVGAALGKADAVLLDRHAAAHGYRYCPALDVWDPHGGRGGGPALSSWGYARGACPAAR